MSLKKIMPSREAREWVSLNIQTIRPLYFELDLTASQIADKFGINYDNNFQKALLRELGKKGKGLGGARTGSGNRKVKLKKTPKPARMPGMQISEEMKKIISEAPKQYGISQSDFITIAIQYFQKYISVHDNMCPGCGTKKLPYTELVGLDPTTCDNCGDII